MEMQGGEAEMPITPSPEMSVDIRVWCPKCGWRGTIFDCVADDEARRKLCPTCQTIVSCRADRESKGASDGNAG